MKRTERMVSKDKKLSHLCSLSKNLYNYANYIVRQEFIRNKRWIRYNELYKMIKKSKDHKALPAQTAQQVLKLLDKNWASFFKAMKAYKKNKSKFKSRPKLPRYKDTKKGKNIVIFTNQQCRIKDGYLIFPKQLGRIKARLDEKTKIREVRIVPQATCYVVEIVYEKKEVKKDVDKNRILGCDLGIDNLLSSVNNIGEKPFVISGRVVKSLNHYYNKKKAQLQSLLKGKKQTSKRILRLTFKRNNKINDYFHKASRMIINYCIKHRIGTIVIGYSPGWKQQVNIGKVNNQNFVQIPFDRLIQQIKYKAEEVGIDVKLVDEAYTSKCSFLDREPIEKKEKYLGKRITRGLFRSADGTLINADCNSAYNLIVKAIPEAFAEGIKGVGLHPVRVTPYEQKAFINANKIA